jgi:PASTA domain
MGERDPAASPSGSSAEGETEESTLAEGDWPVAPQYQVTPEPSAEASPADELGAVPLETPRDGRLHGTPRVALLLTALAALVLVAAAGAWLATGFDEDAPGSTGQPPAGEPGSTPPATGTATTPTTSSPSTDTSTETTAPTPAQVSVPDVVGLKASAALRRLRAVRLRAETNAVVSSRPAGTVVAQVPSAGAEIDRGAVVELRVAKAPPTVRMPRLVGLTAAAAKSRLRDVGLHWTVTESTSQEDAGLVLGQSPSAGEDVRRGATVTLRVSTGPASVAVPDVTGLDEASARTTLQNAGFDVNVVDEPTSDSAEDGTVVGQDPAVGTDAEKGSLVTITVARLG